MVLLRDLTKRQKQLKYAKEGTLQQEKCGESEHHKQEYLLIQSSTNNASLKATTNANKMIQLTLNKCDALDEEAISEKKAALAEAASTRDVMTISGVTGDGVQDALRRLHRAIKSEREEVTQSPTVAARPWNL